MLHGSDIMILASLFYRAISIITSNSLSGIRHSGLQPPLHQVSMNSCAPSATGRSAGTKYGNDTITTYYVTP